MDHISLLRSLHDQLKEMGENIDDKELAMTLLASLPEDYKPLITALDAADLSYEKVKNMLLNDVDRSKDTKNSENAFSARCGKFNKRGKLHQTSESTNQDERRVFQGKCHDCHERGHFVQDFPKRNWKTDSASTPGKGRKVQGAACCAEKQNLCDKFPEEALPVYTSHEFGGSNWIIDSEATQHMIFEKDCLSDYVEFKQPCVVNLGDNCSILAYGKGNYRIKAVVDDHVQPLCLRGVL